MTGGRVLHLLGFALALLSACPSPGDGDGPPGGDGDDGDGSDDGVVAPLPGCTGMDAAWEALVATASQELAAAGVPGAALAVVCEGRTAYAAAWGTTGVDSDEPVTPSTRFQLASTTKMFTAAAALRVAEEGIVDLQQPVDSYVPDASTHGPGGEPVTLHQLLSHTAGYPTGFAGADVSSMDLAGYFANNADQPLWSPPGAVYNYSNLGMSLAGLALEEAVGEPFADLVADRIFVPAGMAGASLDAAAVQAEGNFAHGRTGTAQQSSEVAPTDSYLPSGYYGPMGGAWGSVLDLAAWAEVHLGDGGGVLESASVSALSSPQTETRSSPLQYYGYGLFVDRLYGFDRLSHGGSVAGYLTSWMLVPEADFGVFVVVSCDWYAPSTLGREALDLFVGPEFVDLSDQFSSSADWPAYEGRYVDPHGMGAIEVRQEGAALIADFEDLGFESEGVGSYGDAYRFDYPPWGSTLGIVFWRDEPDGAAEYLVSLDGVATRQD